jgi:hypothetical protein
MDKYHKYILANLISCEQHRLMLNRHVAMEAKDEKAKEFWQSEINKLKEFDNVIWQEIK